MQYRNQEPSCFHLILNLALWLVVANGLMLYFPISIDTEQEFLFMVAGNVIAVFLYAILVYNINQSRK